MKENPCGFASVIGASACSGASPVLALVFQIFAIVLTVVAALIGKSVGDTAEVASPNGGKSYEILKVEYV